MDPSSLVKMGSDNSNVGTGSIQRQETINMTLAALVAQVLPNGNLVIDGHQQVRVNNELRDMRLSGIVRREDITQDNTVDLAQIAEARVTYGGQRHGERCAAAALRQPAARHPDALVIFCLWWAEGLNGTAGRHKSPAVSLLEQVAITSIHRRHPEAPGAAGPRRMTSLRRVLRGTALRCTSA